MRSISNDARRATLDIDIDFIKYSLEDESIRKFVTEINCIEDIEIELNGKIESLKQQDYRGKRVYINVTDTHGKTVQSKIDFGVHTRFNIEQAEYSFDVCLDDDGASMLINTNEQIVTEKLRSLLKLGPFTTRFKDIFDIYYLTTRLDEEKLMVCVNDFVFKDDNMRESNVGDVSSRLKNIFSNKRFRRNLSTTDKNWLEIDVDEVLKGILDYFEQLTT